MLLILLAGHGHCPLMPAGGVWPWVQMLLSCRAASVLGHHTSEAHLGTSMSLYTQLEEAEALNVIEMETETPHLSHGDRLMVMVMVIDFSFPICFLNVRVHQTFAPRPSPHLPTPSPPVPGDMLGRVNPGV